MRVLGFGTYDASKQPRVRVLLDGLTAAGHEVRELNRPLGFSTGERVAMLHRPWLLHRLLLRLVARWSQLAGGRVRLGYRPDVVVVGYLGQFDVILARALFPRALIVLDLLVFADDTARDRGVRRGVRTRLLARLDRVALRCASVVVVDTEENLALVPHEFADKGVVVGVGATMPWFDAARQGPLRSPLKVVFFGLFTPLQGTPVIAEAFASLGVEVPVRLTMVGTGQDHDRVRTILGADPRVTWLDWVEPPDLPVLVAGHDVALGIFGTGPKALRVAPTKAFQALAAGCALVTSDTPPQRRAFADGARYVPPGSAAALAEALRELAADADEVRRLRREGSRHARELFAPAQVVRPLDARLSKRTEVAR